SPLRLRPGSARIWFPAEGSAPAQTDPVLLVAPVESPFAPAPSRVEPERPAVPAAWAAPAAGRGLAPARFAPRWWLAPGPGWSWFAAVRLAADRPARRPHCPRARARRELTRANADVKSVNCLFATSLHGGTSRR